MGFIIYQNGYEAGDNCTRCWGIGKHFGDVDTPRFIYAYFYGIKYGAAAGPGTGAIPNGWYKMEQQVNPCAWDSGAPDPRATLSFILDTTSIQLRNENGAIGFVANPAPACQSFVPNELTEPPNRSFIGGSCILYPGGIGEELLYGLGLSTLDGTRLTMRGESNGDYIVRLTNTQDSTNIKVKLEDDFF